MAARAEEARAAVAEAQARADAARCGTSRCRWQCPDAARVTALFVGLEGGSTGRAVLMQCWFMSGTAWSRFTCC